MIRACLLAAALLATAPVQAQSLNPAVNQGNIASTVCKQGWATKQRPPYAWSHALKIKLLPKGHRLGEYQLDHFIPIEIGGSPTDRKNLWMQPINDALVKDVQENRLHDAVCAGTMTLAQAQAEMLKTWGAAKQSAAP